MSLPCYKMRPPLSEAEKNERLKSALVSAKQQMEEIRRGAVRLYVDTHMPDVEKFLTGYRLLGIVTDLYDHKYKAERMRLRGLMRSGKLTPQQYEEALRPLTRDRSSLKMDVRLFEDRFLFITVR